MGSGRSAIALMATMLAAQGVMEQALASTPATPAAPAFVSGAAGALISSAPASVRDNPASSDVPLSVFEHRVILSVPAGFVSTYENVNGPSYIHEWVLSGENIAHWSQMITLTAARGIGANDPRLTPNTFIRAMAGGFQRACPSSYASEAIYDAGLTAQHVAATVLGCGNAQASDGHSETAVIAAFKVDRDLYTVQWAERGAPSTRPVRIDLNRWTERIKRLIPLQVCSQGNGVTSVDAGACAKP